MRATGNRAARRPVGTSTRCGRCETAPSVRGQGSQAGRSPRGPPGCGSRTPAAAVTPATNAHPCPPANGHHRPRSERQPPESSADSPVERQRARRQGPATQRPAPKAKSLIFPVILGFLYSDPPGGLRGWESCGQTFPYPCGRPLAHSRTFRPSIRVSTWTRGGRRFGARRNIGARAREWKRLLTVYGREAPGMGCAVPRGTTRRAGGCWGGGAPPKAHHARGKRPPVTS